MAGIWGFKPSEQARSELLDFFNTPVQNRYNILPIAEDARTGQNVWAVPGLLAEPFESLKRVIASGGRTDTTYDDAGVPVSGRGTLHDLDGLNVAGIAPMGTAAMGAVPNGVGIFGGRLAKTANHEALSKAERMAAEGAPRENIWNETGWFQGPDQKWRFEIDDSAAQYLGGVKKATRYDKVIDHPDLMDAYPDLAFLPVRPLKPHEKQANIIAGYNPASQEFALKNAQSFDEAAKSAALHETQHHIQGLEGFGVGANDARARGAIYDAETQAAVKAHEDAIASKPRGLSWFNPSAWDEYYSRLSDALVNRQSARSAAADAPRTDAEIYNAYKRFAGETEARAVQARQNLTPQERQARPPWLDYDTPEADQIVRFANPDTGAAAPLSLNALGERGAMGAGPVRVAEPKGFTAYHGSPHDFDKFDLSKIGTGEGAQAYGHGLYFAENEGVARSYRDQLVKADRSVESSPPGRMYEVRINADPEQFLDWDKPLSQQSEAVRQAIGDDTLRFSQETFNKPDSIPSIMRSIVARKTGQIKPLDEIGSTASDALREAGIPGIRYLDQMSRNAGDGSRNYVLFDDSLVDIMRKYANAPTGAAAPLAISGQGQGQDTFDANALLRAYGLL